MIGRWIFLRGGRLSRRDKLALAALVVAALVVAFPLRLALAWAAPAAVTARAVEGVVWGGRIGDLKLGALPLGDVAARLRALPLLLGRRELAIARLAAPGQPEFSAIASGGSGWARLRAVEGQVPLGEGFGTVPASALGFRDFHLLMADGRCREAGGQLSLILAPLGELMPGPLALSGKARCDKGALYAPLTGPSGMERLFVRLEGDGRWKAELVLAGLPPEVAGPLLDQGFSARPGGIGMTARGKL